MPAPYPDGAFWISIDFDGTLVEHGLPLRWRRGAREFLVGAARAGHRVILHSCRSMPVGLRDVPADADEFWRAGVVAPDARTSWRLREEMDAFLRADGVWGLFEVWEAPGKPIANYYVDDRAEVPDWIALAGELGVILEHGVRPQEPAAVGLPQPAAVGPGAVVPTPGGG